MVKKQVFKISGMYCTSCAINIDGDLEDYVKGVKKAQTNYAIGECKVEFEEKIVSIEEIIGQIKKTGYQAKMKRSIS